MKTGRKVLQALGSVTQKITTINLRVKLPQNLNLNKNEVKKKSWNHFDGCLTNERIKLRVKRGHKVVFDVFIYYEGTSYFNSIFIKALQYSK